VELKSEPVNLRKKRSRQKSGIKSPKFFTENEIFPKIVFPKIVINLLVLPLTPPLLAPKKVGKKLTRFYSPLLLLYGYKPKCSFSPLCPKIMSHLLLDILPMFPFVGKLKIYSKFPRYLSSILLKP